jgi:hypothetical protein
MWVWFRKIRKINPLLPNLIFKEKRLPKAGCLSLKIKDKFGDYAEIISCDCDDLKSHMEGEDGGIKHTN